MFRINVNLHCNFKLSVRNDDEAKGDSKFQIQSLTLINDNSQNLVEPLVVEDASIEMDKGNASNNGNLSMDEDGEEEVVVIKLGKEERRTTFWCKRKKNVILFHPLIF